MQSRLVQAAFGALAVLVADFVGVFATVADFAVVGVFALVVALTVAGAAFVAGG